MFIMVLIVFGVCWLPYNAYFLYTYYHAHLLSEPYTQHVFLAFFWLAMANSAFNPIIYFLMSAKGSCTNISAMFYTDCVLLKELATAEAVHDLPPVPALPVRHLPDGLDPADRTAGGLPGLADRRS